MTLQNTRELNMVTIRVQETISQQTDEDALHEG